MEEALADVIRRMDERLQHETSTQQAALLLNAAYILTGLRLPREHATRLFQGVRAMRESSTYQAILDEGRQKGMLRLLQRQARQRFGPPSDAIMATLTTITDLDRLERMADRILTVSSWDELLATP